MSHPSAEYLSQLSQTLSTLTSPGPERQAAETHLSTTLLRGNPAHLILGLITLATSPSAPEDHRILAFVLQRRLSFKPVDAKDIANPLAKAAWDLMERGQQEHAQQLLLAGLAGAASRRENERKVLCGAIAEVAKALETRATPWTALAQTLPQLFGSEALALRSACWQIYTELPEWLANEPAQNAVAGLTAGLRDESAGVKLAALGAGVGLICHQAGIGKIDGYASLALPMLELLPPLAAERSARLTEALMLLVDLATTPKVPARLFRNYLGSLLTFCLGVVDAEEPYDESARATALELLVSLAETAPSLCSSSDYVPQVVPALLKLMSERDEFDSDWAQAADGTFKDDDYDEIAVIAEGALDRLAQALGNIVFDSFTEAFQTMVSSKRWQDKYAALSGLASVAEGCAEPLLELLSEFVGVAIQATRHSHAAVRYAAIYAIGQMCTDCEGCVQDEHGTEVLQAIVGVMQSRELRIQAYAAASTVNFFNAADGTSPAQVESVLPAVFEALLSLLAHGTTFVKENALEALTLQAHFMGDDFGKFYPAIFPELLGLLEHGTGEELQTLRAKALDTAASIGDAVDSSVFAPDALRLLQIMHNIQLTVDPEDTLMQQYLLRAFSQLADTVGPELFGPFISDALPRLIELAEREVDLRLTDGDAAELDEGDEEWEQAETGDGKVVQVRTDELQDKEEAVSNLVVLVQAISSALSTEQLFAILKVAQPLLAFYFHVGVRQSAGSLIHVTIDGLAKQNLDLQQRRDIISAVSDAFATHIAADTDPEIIAMFNSSYAGCLGAMANCLSVASRDLMVKALEAQLTLAAQREHERAQAALQGDADADDEVFEAEQEAADAVIFASANGPLREMLKQFGAEFPLGAVAPFISLAQSKEEGPKHFALKLLADIVQHAGAGVGNSVAGCYPALIAALTDEDDVTRRISSFLVGQAAALHPSVYGDLAVAAVEPLFASAKQHESHLESSMAAKDNAIAALCKIIKSCSAQLSPDALLPRWVSLLPVVVDAEEMLPTTNLLLELISGGHASVSPADPIVCVHVTKVLLSLAQSHLLPAQLKQPVAQALQAYLGALPADKPVAVPAEVAEMLATL